MGLKTFFRNELKKFIFGGTEPTVVIDKTKTIIKEHHHHHHAYSSPERDAPRQSGCNRGPRKEMAAWT